MHFVLYLAAGHGRSTPIHSRSHFLKEEWFFSKNESLADATAAWRCRLTSCSNSAIRASAATREGSGLLLEGAVDSSGTTVCWK